MTTEPLTETPDPAVPVTPEDLFDVAAEAENIAEPGRIFKATFFEMWERALQNMLEGTKAPLELIIAQQIMDAYPWLKHEHLRPYRAARAHYLQRALDMVDLVLVGQKEKVFKEAEKDWELHKQLYIELMAKWNHLVVGWGNGWSLAAEYDGEGGGPDPVEHAAIADVSTLLLNEQSGFIEGLRNLRGFSFDDEDRALLLKLSEEELDQLPGGAESDE